MRLTVRKILSNLMATAGIGAGYLLISFLVEEITATPLDPGSHLAFTVTMVAIAAAYYPLILLCTGLLRRVFPLPQDKLYEILKEVGNSLSTLHEFEDLGLVTCNLLLKGLNLSGVGLYLWENNMLSRLYALGIDDELQASILLLTEPELKADQLYVNKALAYPLFWNNGLVGCLVLRAKENIKVLTKKEMEVAETAVPQIAAAISNTRLYQDLVAEQKQLARAERLSALGTLTAGLAHELRNGLHGIQGFSSLLEEASIGDPNLNRLARGVREDSERLSRMLNNFLQFAGRPELKLELLNLVELLETSVMVVKRFPQSAGVNFTVSHGKKELVADRDKLYQAIINLLLNAVEAKGVTRVKIKSAAAAGGTEICIENDGEAITPANVERAFDPFFTTKSAGTGLGLSIVHQIVLEHGGKIQLKNTGKGTRVEIFLAEGRVRAGVDC